MQARSVCSLNGFPKRYAPNGEHSIEMVQEVDLQQMQLVKFVMSLQVCCLFFFSFLLLSSPLFSSSLLLLSILLSSSPATFFFFFCFFYNASFLVDGESGAQGSRSIKVFHSFPPLHFNFISFFVLFFLFPDSFSRLSFAYFPAHFTGKKNKNNESMPSRRTEQSCSGPMLTSRKRSRSSLTN